MVARAVRALAALAFAASFTPACSRASSQPGSPGPRVSDPPGGTRVGVARTPGPDRPGELVTIGATCPGDAVPSAGGLLADLSTGKPPSPSLRLDSTRPAGTTWAAVVATGGVPEPDAQSTSFVLCPPGDASQVDVVASRPGPARAGSASLTTAQCPAGSVVAGGGGTVDMANGDAAPRFFFLTGSYPSSPAGVPAATGATAPAWTVVGAIGGMLLLGGRVTAIAVCTAGRKPLVVAAAVRGPAAPSTAVAATATCRAGTTLLGGGADTGLPRRTSPPMGLHLRGSYPSHTGGRAPAAGEQVQSWTAVANAGGLPTLGAATTAFALCER